MMMEPKDILPRYFLVDQKVTPESLYLALLALDIFPGYKSADHHPDFSSDQPRNPRFLARDVRKESDLYRALTLLGEFCGQTLVSII